MVPIQKRGTYTDVGCNVDKTGINEILINIKKKNYETKNFTFNFRAIHVV